MRQTIKGWVVALRPHTLPASVVPVLVGGALAVQQNAWHTTAFLSALCVALLLQMSVNLANDYFDFQKGVDVDDHTGFPRACADGLLSPRSVKIGMVVLILASLLPGGLLVVYAGLPALLIGVASVLALLGYSGGPLPYGSYALGDFMVFVFFGLIATVGTHYVQFCARYADTVPMAIPDSYSLLEPMVVSVPIGTLSTAILVINNLRDLDQDKESGKRTLAVVLGRYGSLVEFILLVLTAYVVPLMLVRNFDYPGVLALPLISLPLGLMVSYDLMFTNRNESQNRLLEQTGRLMFLYGLLYSLGLVLAA